MFQRKPERRQLHSVDANSAFFTRTEAKSPIEVGYGESGAAAYKRTSRQVRKPSSPGSSSSTVFFLIIWTAFLGGIGYLWLEYVKLPEVRSEIHIAEVEPTKHLWKQKVATLESSLEDLEAENERLKKVKPENKNENKNTKNDQSKTIDSLNRQLKTEKQKGTKLKEKADAAQVAKNVAEKSVKDLQRSIQTVSKRVLLEKYGAGPYKVEFEVSFPTDRDHFWYFTVELAPLRDMPHTIHTFLEQVSRNLFNDGGFSFYSRASHVIQGGPKANHLTTPKDRNPNDLFQHSGYTSVLFQEYSKNFPHKKYTLGLSGRPGGPSFYINMVDNTKNHGPGGYAADGTGDPCFGKVIIGFDVVDRMHTSGGEAKNGEWKDTEGGPIAVRSVKILGK